MMPTLLCSPFPVLTTPPQVADGLPEWRIWVQAIIDMNFEYLTIDDRVPQLQVAAFHRPVSAFYSLAGTRLTLPRRGDVVLVRHSDGRIVKTLYK